MAEGDPRLHEDTTSEYLREFWLHLKSIINAFLCPHIQTGPISFQETFNLVYKCVDCGFSDRLYADLREVMLKHLKGLHVELLNCLTSDSESSQELCVLNMIKKFEAILADYIFANKGIAAAFSYLVQGKYLSLKHNCKSLEEEMNMMFCCEVAEHFIHDILSCIDRSPPFTLDPALLNRLFRNLQIVSRDQYGMLYSKLFSRFVTDALPPMQEHDLEAHIAEIRELQTQMRWEQHLYSLNAEECFNRNPAQKRSADD